MYTYMFTGYWEKIYIGTLQVWYTAGDGLSESELEAVASGVIEECDISKNKRLSYAEFEHVVSRAPDFVNLFHITI